MPDSEIWYGGHRLLLHDNLDGTFSPGVYGGVSGAAAALVPTAVKTTNYTAAVKDFVPVDTTSGAVTITLPTAPADGSLIGVKLVILGAGNFVTIARGGSDVFNKAGGSTSLTLSRLNQSVLLQYKASTSIWYVTTADNALAIGSDVQAWDADLDALAALTAPASKLNAIPTLFAATSAELTAAIAALPAGGGVIQLTAATITYTSGGFSLNGKTGITIRGVGGRTAGADSATVIKFNDTGSGTLIDMGDSIACGLEDLELLVTSASFTGTLMKHASTGQTNGCWLLNVMLSTATKATTQTCILLDLNQAIVFTAKRCFFLGGGIGTRGRASSATTDFSNIVTFEECVWSRQAIIGVRNPGEAWSFIGCSTQGTEAAGALADGKWIDHDSGVLASALNISGGGCYDITSANNSSWIKFGGVGLSIHGYKATGKNSTQITFVTIDENASDAIDISGNYLNQIYRGLDFGATTGHLTGAFFANAHPGNPAGWKLVDGSTIPTGIMLMDSNVGVTQGREFAFFWDGGVASTALQFDGDTVARIYRSAAGILYSPAEWRIAGDIYAGFGQTANTRVRGQSGGTYAGLLSGGSNATVELALDGKGATPDVGGVTVGLNAANGGMFKLARSFSLTSIISPAQLVANTDNWAPTGVASAYLVRVNVDAARNITGIVAPTNNLLGQTLWLYNTTAFTITLVHDATSTAANRFFCPNKANYALLQGASVQLIYSATDSRWLVLAGGA